MLDIQGVPPVYPCLIPPCPTPPGPGASDLTKQSIKQFYLIVTNPFTPFLGESIIFQPLIGHWITPRPALMPVDGSIMTFSHAGDITGGNIGYFRLLDNTGPQNRSIRDSRILTVQNGHTYVWDQQANTVSDYGQTGQTDQADQGQQSGTSSGLGAMLGNQVAVMAGAAIVGLLVLKKARIL